MKNNLTKKIILAFILLLLFHIISINWWLKIDKHLPQVDESVHLTYSIIIFSYLKQSFSNFASLTNISSYYPPFYHFTTALKYFFSDTSFDSAVKINIFFLIILLLSTFFIAKNFYSLKIAFICCCLLSFYPEILHYYKLYFIDFTLTSLVTFYTLLILNKKFLNNIYFSLFTGFILGIGLLTKWTFIFFTFPPTLYLIYYFYLKKVKDLFFNVFTFLAGGILISSFWYLPNLNKLIPNLIFGNKLGLSTGDVSYNNFKFYIYYLLYLPQIISIPACFLFIISLLFFLKKEKNHLKKTILIQIVFSFILLTLLFNKDPRFILPVLPLVAIISVYLFKVINKYFQKIFLLTFIFIFCSYNFFKVNFYLYPPNPLNFQPEIIAKEIYLSQKANNASNKMFLLTYFTDSENFNTYNLRYYLLENFLLKNNIENFKIQPFTNLNNFLKIPSNYFLLHTNVLNNIPKKLKLLLKNNFKLLKEIKLNKNNRLLLYKYK